MKRLFPVRALSFTFITSAFCHWGLHKMNGAHTEIRRRRGGRSEKKEKKYKRNLIVLMLCYSVCFSLISISLFRVCDVCAVVGSYRMLESEHQQIPKWNITTEGHVYSGCCALSLRFDLDRIVGEREKIAPEPRNGRRQTNGTHRHRDKKQIRKNRIGICKMEKEYSSLLPRQLNVFRR